MRITNGVKQLSKLSALLTSLLVVTSYAMILQAHAQETTPTPDASKTTDVVIASLQAEVDSLERSQDRLIQTVWGALGVVAVAATLVVGAQIIGSGRSYDRDRDSLRQEVSNSVAGLGNDIRLEVQTAFGIERAKFEEMAELYRSKSENLLREMVLQHDSEIREEFEQRHTSLSQKIATIREELNLFHIAYLQERYREKSKDPKAYGLLSIAVELLELTIKRSWAASVYIPEALERIQQVIESGDELDADDRVSVLNVLRQVPNTDEFKMEIDRITEMLRVSAKSGLSTDSASG